MALDTVCWPGDLDIAPETLYDRSAPVKVKVGHAGVSQFVIPAPSPLLFVYLYWSHCFLALSNWNTSGADDFASHSSGWGMKAA